MCGLFFSLFFFWFIHRQFWPLSHNRIRGKSVLSVVGISCLECMCHVFRTWNEKVIHNVDFWIYELPSKLLL